MDTIKIFFGSVDVKTLVLAVILSVAVVLVIGAKGRA